MIQTCQVQSARLMSLLRDGESLVDAAEVVEVGGVQGTFNLCGRLMCPGDLKNRGRSSPLRVWYHMVSIGYVEFLRSG